MRIAFASSSSVLPLLVFFLLKIKDSNQQCFGPNDFGKPNPLGHRILYTGQQGFSLALLDAIHQLYPNENLFFSPYSTYHALLTAYFLSGKQTETYLTKILRLNETLEKSDVYSAYKLDKFVTANRAKNSSYEFKNANKIYVADRIKVRDCILRALEQELVKTDFKNNPEAARVAINTWVENETHDMIRDLLPKGTVDSTTDLVLVNAAYFKGFWENKFNPNETKEEVFYVKPSKAIPVEMMHVEGTFNHDVSESLGAHILEMPYQGGNISMYILLPPFAKEGAIDATLKKLALDEFKNIVESGRLLSRTVQVSMPKFSLEHTIELTPILESLGVGNLFQSDADFSDLTSEKVSVGAGIHKARIDLNEQGSQAAAATAIFSWRMMADEDDLPVEFKCNRPFLFIIYNKELHTILFVGVYRKPSPK